MAIATLPQPAAAHVDGRTDGELLARVVADGSEDCFAELVRRHGAMVAGACRRQLGNTSDADDAVQAVFLILWKKARSLQRRSSIAGWLHNVARNVCRDAQKARRVRAARERDAAEQKSNMHTADREFAEIRGLLDEELDALPEKYRLPIILFHLEGHSLEEVAALLGTKPSTVGSRLARGRERLRSRMARRGLVVTVAALTAAMSANATSAAVSASFVANMVQAASLYGAGAAGAGGLVSAKAVALTQGTMNMLTLAKLRLATAVMATVTIATTTSVVVVQSIARAEPDGAVEMANELPKNEIPLRVLWRQDRMQTGEQRMPLDWPLATVTRQPRLDKAALEGFLAQGQLDLQPANDDKETVAILVSPPLDIGKFWRPVRVHRDDKQITIVAEWWTDNESRRQNIRRQSLYLVSLGKLDAGEYTLGLQVREMFRDFANREKTTQYHERSVLTASTQLLVAERGSEDEIAIATINRDAFKTTKGDGRIYQPNLELWRIHGRRVPTIHYLEFKHGIDGTIKPGGASVGSYDLQALWKEDPKAAADFYKMKYHPPTAGMPVCLRVQSIYMNLSETMTLREMEWVGDKKVVVRLDMWRNDIKTEGDYPRVPVLFVPLRKGNLPIDDPGEYEVHIEWNLWYDTDGKIYRRYTLDNIGDAEIPKRLKTEYKYMDAEQKGLTFTLRAAAAEKDGLSVTIKPVKPVFAVEEHLVFDVTFKNMSEKPFRLMDPTRFYADSDPLQWANWTHTFLPGPKEAIGLSRDRRAAPRIRLLQPGDELTVRPIINGAFRFLPPGKKRADVDVRGLPAALPEGRHQYQPTIKFSGVRDNDPIPFWTGEITAKPAEFTIAGMKRIMAERDAIASGEPKEGVRLGLAPAKLRWDTENPSIHVEIWYENVRDEPCKVPQHHMQHSANLAHVMFAGEADGKPYELAYLVPRRPTQPPKKLALVPGEKFRERIKVTGKGQPEGRLRFTSGGELQANTGAARSRDSSTTTRGRRWKRSCSGRSRVARPRAGAN